MAIGQGSSQQSEELEHLFSINPKDPIDKISTVREIFLTSGAAEATRDEIEKYSNHAFSLLEIINISEEKREMLREFGNSLMQRNVWKTDDQIPVFTKVLFMNILRFSSV